MGIYYYMKLLKELLHWSCNLHGILQVDWTVGRATKLLTYIWEEGVEEDCKQRGTLM